MVKWEKKMKNKYIKLILILMLISCCVFSGCTGLSFNNKSQSACIFNSKEDT